MCVLQISVDGDTSTNDTVIGLASGAAGNTKITDLASPEAKQLEDAVTALLQVGPAHLLGFSAQHCVPTMALHHKHIAMVLGVWAALATCPRHNMSCVACRCRLPELHVTKAASRSASALQGLAKSIAWDGEGATCLIEVQTSGAASDEDARKISKSVVASSLVKAAVYGHDPNWGRIACAAG